GDGLEGMRVSWRAGTRAGGDACLNVVKDRGRDLCSLDVDRKLPADPRAVTLYWAPPGGRADPDTVTYDHAGAVMSEEQMRLPVARLLVGRVFPATRTVDIASGEGRVELAHPEAVSSADCGTARCETYEGGVIVRAVPAASTSITARVRLLPRVFLAHGEA